jgi:hypothetical protein
LGGGSPPGVGISIPLKHAPKRKRPFRRNGFDCSVPYRRVRASKCGPKASEVGTDLRAVRHRRDWRFRRNRPTREAAQTMLSQRFNGTRGTGWIF